MNLTKHPNLEKNIFFGRGAGGGVVEKGASSLGKYIFPIYKYIISYRVSSSYFLWFTSFKTNKRNNRQERDITPEVFYGIHPKVKEVILRLILSHTPNIRILAQAVLKISLTRFFCCYNGRVKGALLSKYLTEFAKKVNRVI